MHVFKGKKIKYDLFINSFISKFDDTKFDHRSLIEFIKMNILSKYNNVKGQAKKSANVNKLEEANLILHKKIFVFHKNVKHFVLIYSANAYIRNLIVCVSPNKTNTNFYLPQTSYPKSM